MILRGKVALLCFHPFIVFMLYLAFASFDSDYHSFLSFKFLLKVYFEIRCIEIQSLLEIVLVHMSCYKYCYYPTVTIYI